MLKKLLYMTSALFAVIQAPEVHVNLIAHADTFAGLRASLSQAFRIPLSMIGFADENGPVTDFTIPIQELHPGAPANIRLILTPPEVKILQELPGLHSYYDTEISRNGENMNVSLLYRSGAVLASEDNVGRLLVSGIGIVFKKKNEKGFLFQITVMSRGIKEKHAASLALKGLEYYDGFNEWTKRSPEIDPVEVLQGFLRDKRLVEDRHGLIIPLGEEVAIRICGVYKPRDFPEMSEEFMHRLLNLSIHGMLTIEKNDRSEGNKGVFEFMGSPDNVRSILPFVITEVLPEISDVLRGDIF